MNRYMVTSDQDCLDEFVNGRQADKEFDLRVKRGDKNVRLWALGRYEEGKRTATPGSEGA